MTTRRGAGGFVGRSAELARLEGLLDHRPPVNVVLLHGPAGIGESALLHELARRAGESTVVAVDAREVAPLAEKVDRALAPAITARRPLVLLDSWERLAALDGHLRRAPTPPMRCSPLVA